MEKRWKKSAGIFKKILLLQGIGINKFTLLWEKKLTCCQLRGSK
jgi:hypothetical protein